MKKQLILLAVCCLLFSSCGNSLGGAPVTVSEPALSPQSQANLPQQLEWEADREGASQTPGGVYYRPSRYYDPSAGDSLPEGPLSMEAAAQRANEYAASMGLPLSGAVWELRPLDIYENFPGSYWECSASLPPYTSHRIEYQADLEHMAVRQQPWSVRLVLDGAGNLMRYYCSPVDPFDLEEHTAQELQEHQQQQTAWKNSDECRQTLLDGAATLGVGPVKRLLAPDETCLEWRLELENGDTYFADAFFGKKELYELYFSGYYINGDQLRAQ